jgi:solute carrier family 35
MVFGAVIAAFFDLTFDLIGVMYVLANDVLTSLVGVYMEKKMDAKEFNSWGLMFYNSLFSIPFLFAYMFVEGKEVPLALSPSEFPPVLTNALVPPCSGMLPSISMVGAT